ncbi:hypothetical protein BOTNAR_0701g00010 [Botryotinia narcissicola]|uniref:TauD/TfdA-like domain-containing protein n=1 Tax=Botryotinia narcissicola TaxID=278944 RepID=A0A4Z1H7H7_9HELO|nr:hypothetical protein BOTNAR_0701g00010 [Botryotinia narcissicola]
MSLEPARSTLKAKAYYFLPAFTLISEAASYGLEACQFDLGPHGSELEGEDLCTSTANVIVELGETIDYFPDLITESSDHILSFQYKMTATTIVPTIGRQPLQLGNSLDGLMFQEITRVLGREYIDVQVTDLLHAEDSEAKLRDLGIVLAERGVVVFKSQKLSPKEQKELAQRLGEATGKPKESSLHRVTSDYSTLYMRTIPSTGGDTLFASAYEVYDRISPAYQKFLETLTCTFMPVGYQPNPEHKALYEVERGHPLNIDQSLTASHPVVRTNPVTGWKSVFAVGHHAQFINELTPLESQQTLDFLNNLISKNHDLQLRFKWNVDDLVIWDNRSVYHTATYDYSEPRAAHRVVSVGEAPTLLEGSISRGQALGLL